MKTMNIIGTKIRTAAPLLFLGVLRVPDGMRQIAE